MAGSAMMRRAVDIKGLRTVRQQGFSLIVALMMLIVIIILGISSSQMAINEERGARNDRDRQIAFQAAEAALKDAEYEILNPLSPACNQPAPLNSSRGRAGSTFCFNQFSGVYSAAGCASTPATAVGLCTYDNVTPAYMSPTVNFYGDASGSGGFGNTVQYGQFTGQVFPSQASAGSTTPLSKYPPRYIIEVVPRNVALADETCTNPFGCKMFRVTAMGFGANPNSQVVLQSVVSTRN